MTAVHDVDDLVRFFCINPSTAQYGPYLTLKSGRLKGSPVVDGCLWFYRVFDAQGAPVDLHVYTGLADLGGSLWEQELRVLFRLGNSALQGFPEVIAGGYQDATSVAGCGGVVGGAAFIATQGSDDSMAADHAKEVLRGRPVQAVNCFSHLLQALSELHEYGVAHRSLSPATIYHDGGMRLRIARFEMSALVDNLIDLASVDAGVDDDTLRAFFRRRLEGVDPLCYCPPERLPYLLEDAPFEEDMKGDVFSLAATVWEWFFDPADLPPLVDGTPAERTAAVKARHQAMRRATADGTVPARLGRLLASMLEDDPRSRPSSANAAYELSKDYNLIVSHWDDTRRNDRPYAVLYMKGDSDRTLLQWGWTNQSSATDIGEQELREVITEDLRNAHVLHSEHGAAPYVRSGGEPEKEAAKVLLLGSRGAWFCQFYRWEHHGVLGSVEERALLIKYVVEREHAAVRQRLEDLVQQSDMRALPAVELFSHKMSREFLKEELEDRPSWHPLLELVESEELSSPADRRDRARIEWTLEYQGARLQARMYPYVLVENDHGEAELQYDRQRDLDRIRRSALLTKIDDSRGRLDFGVFFGSLGETETGLVHLCPDSNGAPAWHDKSEWKVVGTGGLDRVAVTAPRRHDRTRRPRPPSRGWIRPAEDVGTVSALHRQNSAYWELADSARLLRQLRVPMAVKLLPHRWEQAGAGLTGLNSRAVLQDMLSHQPFFAVQGPPGTGKTRLVAEAVKHYLDAHPGSRVLISAQSGYALDNLAERVLRGLGALDEDGRPTDSWPGLAVRVASGEHTDSVRVSSEVEPWLRDQATVRELRRVRRRVDAALAAVPAADPVVPVLHQWQDMLDVKASHGVVPELGDRLQRSANVVFATCAMSTPDRVTPGGARAQFDWVIVEEAAKAWLTELAVPLVRGTRWTLIGDHKQLGAHGREDFERFIESCAGDTSAGLAEVYARKAEYLEVFDGFERIFQHFDETNPEKGALRRLKTQFRMRRPLAECVGRVFYPDPTAKADPDGLPQSGLHTGREVEPSWVREPAALRGESLVWLDTGNLPDRGDEPRWRNPGEARLVSALVKAMGSPPAEAGSEGLAILTPYLDQVKELRDVHGLGDLVHTVHSFQGREADVVVVSLVRSTSRGGALRSLGHLTQPNLINVLMSRARRLLVIVGDYAHFTSVAAVSPELEFWRLLTTAINRFGTVLHAEEVLGGPR